MVYLLFFYGKNESEDNKYIALQVIVSAYGAVAFSDNGQYACSISNEGIFYHTTIDYNNYEIEFVEFNSRSLDNWLIDNKYAKLESNYLDDYSTNTECKYCIFSKDNSRLYLINTIKDGYANHHVYIFLFDLNMSNEDNVIIGGSLVCTKAYGYSSDFIIPSIFVSEYDSYVYAPCNNTLYQEELKHSNKVIAIKYKGEFFYNPQGISENKIKEVTDE